MKKSTLRNYVIAFLFVAALFLGSSKPAEACVQQCSPGQWCGSYKRRNYRWCRGSCTCVPTCTATGASTTWYSLPTYLNKGCAGGVTIYNLPFGTEYGTYYTLPAGFSYYYYVMM